MSRTTLRRPTRTTPTAPSRPVEEILREIAYALHATRRLSRDAVPLVRDREASECRPLAARGA